MVYQKDYDTTVKCGYGKTRETFDYGYYISDMKYSLTHAWSGP